MTKRALRRLRATPTTPKAQEPTSRSWYDRLHEAVAYFQAKPQAKAVNLFAPAQHPKSVMPERSQQMAQDGQIAMAMDWASEFATDGLYGSPIGFAGYPILAELAQRPEYRRICEVIATEMTRRWIKVRAKGDEDKQDRVVGIVQAFDRLRIRDLFRRIAEEDGFFGRGHLYVDLGDDIGSEAATSIGGGRDAASKAKVAKGKLRGFKTVEAVWCYPQGYNTTSPIASDWYCPQAWMVMGKRVHATRLLTFVGREVPDILKPAYSFGGLSMTQMAMPYVNNWLRTRQSVADLISSFSVSGIKTNLTDAIMLGGDKLERRIALFNAVRDNRGTMALNKDEEFFNVSTPLGTLDVLQAQTQEHMASVSGIPLVKLLGISPSGLNASSEGEIRVFYDGIHAYQEKFYRPNLQRVMDFVQLSEFGDVDEDITFDFEPLWSLDEKERADVDKVKADTAQVRIESGVILPEEERVRLAGEEDTPYPGLDLSVDVAPPPGEADEDLPDAPEPETDDDAERDVDRDEPDDAEAV